MTAQARAWCIGMVFASGVLQACGGDGGSGGAAGDPSHGAGGASGNGGVVGTGGGNGGVVGTGGGNGGVVGTGGGNGGVVGTGGKTTGSGGRVSVTGGSATGAGGVAAGSGGSSGAAGGTGACVPDYACKPKSPNTGDIYADCVARVNQFRACVCLPPLPRWSAGEACADQDASYDAAQNSAHAGFQARICSSGNAQDECPGWGSSAESVIDGCLQMMFNEGPPPTATCTDTCYSQHGHYINMTGTKYKSGVACGFFTTSSGSLWSVQNFQ